MEDVFGAVHRGHVGGLVKGYPDHVTSGYLCVGCPTWCGTHCNDARSWLGHQHLHTGHRALGQGAIVGHRVHLITELLVARVTGQRFVGDGAPPIWGLSYDLGHTMGGEGHKDEGVLVYARGIMEVEKG